MLCTPELQASNTPELQVKTYAGVTGGLIDHTPELQVKTKCKVIDTALKNLNHQLLSKQKFNTIRGSYRLKVYAGVTGGLINHTPEL